MADNVQNQPPSDDDDEFKDCSDVINGTPDQPSQLIQKVQEEEKIDDVTTKPQT